MTKSYVDCGIEQVQLSQLTGSHDQLTVKCDQQRAQPNLSADDEVLLTARGRLSLI